MSRAIDGETLYERACDLEAQALAYIEKIVNDETKIEEWRIWSAILVERTAFKQDIFDAPEVKPEPHWIPCSERLPKKNGFYLCTTKDCITILEFIEGNPHYHEEPSFVSDVLGKCNSYVVAWMPLPEPYAERRTDE